MTISLLKNGERVPTGAEDMSAALKEFVEIVGNFLYSSMFVNILSWEDISYIIRNNSILEMRCILIKGGFYKIE